MGCDLSFRTICLYILRSIFGLFRDANVQGLPCSCFGRGLKLIQGKQHFLKRRLALKYVTAHCMDVQGGGSCAGTVVLTFHIGVSLNSSSRCRWSCSLFQCVDDAVLRGAIWAVCSLIHDIPLNRKTTQDRRRATNGFVRRRYCIFILSHVFPASDFFKWFLLYILQHKYQQCGGKKSACYSVRLKRSINFVLNHQQHVADFHLFHSSRSEPVLLKIWLLTIPKSCFSITCGSAHK